MMLIPVNIFNMNNKELYKKDIKNNNNNNHLQYNKKMWTIFENFEGSGSNLHDY